MPTFHRVDPETLARVREFRTDDDDAAETIAMLLRALEASYAEIDRLAEFAAASSGLPSSARRSPC